MKINEIISSVDKDKIMWLLDKYFYCTDATIDDNGYVSCIDNVYLLTNDSITVNRLPVKFLKVAGDFIINNNQLTTLEGCPIEVGGDFECKNNLLTSLVGGPEKVVNDYRCVDNKLTSLVGIPKNVTATFKLSYDKNLPLLRLLTLTNFTFDNHSNINYAFDIMTVLLKYAGQGRKAALDCAVDLLSLGKKLNIDLTMNARW